MPLTPTASEEELFAEETPWDEEFPAAAPNFDPSNILDEVLADPIRGYEMFLMHHHGEKVARAGMKPGKDFDSRLATLVSNAEQLVKLRRGSQVLGPFADQMRFPEATENPQSPRSSGRHSGG